MFWENFTALCKEKNINPTTVVKLLTNSSSNATVWKTNLPKTKYLISIADYFNCSVDYLLGRSTAKNTSSTNDSSDFYRLLISDKGLIEVRRKLSPIINSYGIEKLADEMGVSFMDIKQFLTSDLSLGISCQQQLDKMLTVLGTNLYELFTSNNIQKNLPMQAGYEIAALGGKGTEGTPPSIFEETT